MENIQNKEADNERSEVLKEFPHQIEEAKKLSESMLWEIQKEYFERMGSSAWSEGQVPHYITSNPYFANAYAQVVLGFLKDLHNRQELKQPLQIIELGAGIGRFSFHFLKRLDELVHKEFKGLPENCFRYIITDFTDKNVSYCQNHPKLIKYKNKGVLDFALFDITQQEKLELWESKEIIGKSTDNNYPIILVGNYVFDTIPQDSFYIKEGVLYEMKASLFGNKPDLEKEKILANIRVNYDYSPAGIHYYQEDSFNTLLNKYQSELAETSVLIPTESMRCIERVKQWSNGDFMLLSSDRGVLHKKDLFDQDVPGIAIHDGCFSMPVNFHAFIENNRINKGGYLTTHHEHTSLNTVALLSKHEDNFTETQFAYQHFISNFGPDDFFVFTTTAGVNYPNMEAVQILCYWRLSRWDAKFFLESVPALSNKIDDITEPLKTEIYHGLYKIWENFYPIGEDNDVAFQIGAVMFRLEHYKEAISFFENSLENYGEDARTFSNMGLCYYFMKEYSTSLELMEKVLKFNPEHATARKMIPTLKSVIERG